MPIRVAPPVLAPLELEPDQHLLVDRLGVEPVEPPGQVDRPRPPALRVDGADVVDVARRELLDVQRLRVADHCLEQITRARVAGRGQRLRRGRVVRADRVLQRLQGMRCAGRVGLGRGPAGRGCDVRLGPHQQVGHERDHDDQRRQGAREHPRTATRHGASVSAGQNPNGQMRRVAPEYGIEKTPETRMPAPGLAASTIRPLPMYIATWLIGE